MRSKFGNISAITVSVICVVAFLLISIRLFAKEILVDAMHIRNEKVSAVANYYWGDQIADYPEENLSLGSSEEYSDLRKIYDDAILNDDTEETENEDVKLNIIQKYEAKVESAKGDIDRYCNFHFLLRPYLTDLKLGFSNLLHWNMSFARKDGDEYMLKNGVVDKAVEKADEVKADLNVKEMADKAGVDYIFLQYPFRENSSDSYVPYGVENWSNENADAYLEALKNNGAEVLDLRKEMSALGWDNHKGYYLTDSHWTTDSGFMASRIISKYLAENHKGFKYHEQYHDESSYSIQTIKLNNPMIRENVRIYMPDFETSFRFISMRDDAEDDVEKVGTLADSIFDMRKIEEGRFSNVLTAYSVSSVGNSLLTETENLSEGDHEGTVLYISNSFSWHIIPYLAMDCDKIYFLHIDAKDSAGKIMERVKPDIVIEAPF